MSRLLQAGEALRRQLVVKHAYLPLAQALPGLEGAEASFDMALGRLEGPDLRVHALILDDGADPDRWGLRAENLRRALVAMEDRIPGRIKAVVWVLADGAVRAAQMEGAWFDAEDGHFLAKTLVARGVLCLETQTGAYHGRLAPRPGIDELALSLELDAAPTAAEASDLLRRREREDAQSRRLLNGKAVVTWGLIALNILAFALQIFVAGQSDSPQAWHQSLLALGANVPALTLSLEPWRLFTAFFLHAGLWHVGLNMMSLYSLGRMAEGLMGPWRFLLLYLLCGLAGSLATAFFGPPHIPSLGASGAIFGVAGSLLAPRWRRDPRFPQDLAQRLFQWLVRPLAFFLALGVVLSALDQPLQLDNFGHLGGLLCGFTIAYAYPPFLIRKTDKRI